MDKSRVVRRGASRLSRQRIKQSGQKPLSDKFVFLEKSKKERLVKKLSVINKESSSSENCEMGCDVSDRENQIPSRSQSLVSNVTAKRFKLPKKLSNGCNDVHHASVPRKLRSAVKKRYRESVSPPLPDSKKLDHTAQKDGVKKPKLDMKPGSSDWSTKQADSGPITKDEEEVVETLYALAGMFPENDSSNKSKVENAPLEVRSSISPECRESITPSEDPAVVKEKESRSPRRTCETVSSAVSESSLKETVERVRKVDSLNEPADRVQEQPDSETSASLCVKSDNHVPQENPHSVNLSSVKKEHNDEKPPCDPVKYHVPSELGLDSGLKQSPQYETSHPEKKPEFSVKNPSMQQDINVESSKNGLALWPELSPIMSHGAGSSSRSTVAKVPAWLDAAISTSSSSSEKVYKVVVNGKKLKRCAAHVYISHLIRDLQKPEKEKLPLQQSQLRQLHEIPKRETQMENNFEKLRKGLNGFISSNNIGSSSSLKQNQNEDRSGFLQQQRKLHQLQMQQQQQTAVASKEQSIKKQNFDFLTLSAGGGESVGSKTANRIGNNRLVPSSPNFQVPYFGFLAQGRSPNVMPSSMPPTPFSSAYSNQLSTSASATAQQVQQLPLPLYIGNPFLSPQQHVSPAAFTKQQQQQQLWAAQLTSQYRPMENSSTAVNQFPSWLNGRLDPSMIDCHQAMIPPTSSSSLGVFGPRYNPISEHQQQPFGASALHHARVKRQDHPHHHHHMPSMYEEVEGGFHPSGGGGALPLQLLCNERL